MKIKSNRSDKAFLVIVYVVLTLVLIAILYPLYFVVLASFTDPAIVSLGQLYLLPKGIFMEGYKTAFAYEPLWRGYANSAVYTLIGTIISTAVTVTAGYVLSRRDLVGRNVLMGFFTFTMFFGGGMISSYLLIQNLKLYDTMWALLLPAAVSVYNMIVCKTFFQQTIPQELLDASRVDGATDFTFYFRIVLPLSSTIIAVMALYNATGRWNSYFDSMIYMRTSTKMPLQLVLRELLLLGASTNSAERDPQLLAEANKRAMQMKYCVIVLSSAPMLMLYPFLQRFFVKGVMIGSIKE